MKDKEKAKQIAEKSQILSDFLHDYHSVEYGAIKMAKWKDKQSRLKEKKLIEKCINECGVMMLDIDIILRKKGLKGQFEDVFDEEYKKFRKTMEGQQ